MTLCFYCLRRLTAPSINVQNRFDVLYALSHSCAVWITALRKHTIQQGLDELQQMAKINYLVAFSAFCNLSNGEAKRTEEEQWNENEKEWQCDSVKKNLIMHFIVNCNKTQRMNSVKEQYIYSTLSKTTCILLNPHMKMLFTHCLITLFM